MHPDSRRFGVLRDHGRSSPANVNGKFQVTVYKAWKKRMQQLRKSIVPPPQQKMDMPFMLHRDESDYVMMLESFLVDHTDWHRCLPGALPGYLVSFIYDSLPFKTRSEVLCQAAKYETKHRASGEES